MANPKVHQFFIPRQLPTPALYKRLSLIFLWVKFSQRASIPIVNPLLKTVCTFGGRWCAHYYSASPKYRKITYNFWNQPPLLVTIFWKYDDKFNSVFEIKLMSAVFLWLLTDIDMCYLLPIYQHMANEGFSAAKVDYSNLLFSNAGLDQKLENKIYVILWMLQNNCDRNDNRSLFRNFREKWW